MYDDRGDGLVSKTSAKLPSLAGKSQYLLGRAGHLSTPSSLSWEVNEFCTLPGPYSRKEICASG